MTVKEALNTYKGTVIKLGADAGFIYCDLCDDTTEQYVRDYDKAERKRIRETLRVKRRYIKNFEKIWERREAIALKKYEEKAKKGKTLEKTKEQLLEEIKALKAKDHVKAVKTLELTEKRVETYTPLIDREIREIYKAIHGETIILFKGLESGNYWTVDEFRAREGAANG